MNNKNYYPNLVTLTFIYGLQLHIYGCQIVTMWMSDKDRYRHASIVEINNIKKFSYVY